MKTKKSKRILALCMAVLLTCSNLSVTTLAEGEPEAAETEILVTEEQNTSVPEETNVQEETDKETEEETTQETGITESETDEITEESVMTESETEENETVAETEEGQTEQTESEEETTELQSESETDLEETETELAVTETETETEISFEETESETLSMEEESEAETENIPKTKFSYNDSRVYIYAVASEDANLPQNAVLKADYLPEGSTDYHEAISTVETQMGSEDQEFLGFVCYDIYFEADGTRIEPEEGKIQVTLRYKGSVFEDVADQAEEYVTYHIDGETNVVEEVTETVNTNSDGALNSVKFSTESFSVFVSAAVTSPKNDEEKKALSVSYNKYNMGWSQEENKVNWTHPADWATTKFEVTITYKEKETDPDDQVLTKKQLAYCLESMWTTPSEEDTPVGSEEYENIFNENSNLQKILYYGCGGPGDVSEEFLTQEAAFIYRELKIDITKMSPAEKEDFFYILTHVAASYEYYASQDEPHPTLGWDAEKCAFWGVNENGKNVIKRWYSYLTSQPETRGLQLKRRDGNSWVDVSDASIEVGDGIAYQLTGKPADSAITISVPAGIKCSVTKDGNTKEYGADGKGVSEVKIYSGSEFTFSVVQYCSDTVNTSYSKSFKGDKSESWSVAVITYGEGKNTMQDIGALTLINTENNNELLLSYRWKKAAIRVTKTEEKKPSKVLSNAEFGVYTDAECKTEPIATIITGKNGTGYLELTISDQIKDNTVYLKETKAPEGYTIGKTIYDAKLTPVGTDEEVIVTEITAEDKLTSVTVKKIGEDSTGVYVPLSGATLQILDANRQVVSLNGERLQWESDGKGWIIEGLPVGTYYVHEESAPAGYLKSEDIEFRITDDVDAQGNEVPVENKATVMFISKVDITGKEELEGAHLRVLNEDGNVVTTATGEVLQWKSGTEAKVIYGLQPGTYTLEETIAPDGYTIANNITFTMNEDGTVSGVKDNCVFLEDSLKVMKFAKINTHGEAVSGAELEIHKATDDVENPIGDLVVLNDETLKWTTGSEPKEIQGMHPGTYYLVETKAPSGYAKAIAKQFTVDQSQQTVTVEMTDCKTLVKIKKTLELLEGQKDTLSEQNPAVFEIYKEGDAAQTAKATVTITEADKFYEVEGLEVGDYILHETKAPAGYALAADQKFTVTDEMKAEATVIASEVTVNEKLTEVTISKKDITRQKEELEGAKLTVLDAVTGKTAVTVLGEELSWTSTKEAKVIKGLSAGEYILREETAPNGYVVAEEMQFTLSEDGTVKVGGEELENNTVTMLDDTTKVKISKQDMTTGEEIEGARLILKDSQGTIVADWMTDGSPKMIEGSLTAGETYTLTEIFAPEGYEVAETVSFTVAKDGKIQTVVMQDKHAEGKGRIQIRKYVKLDDSYLAVDYTFYAALFSDAECTDRVSSVIPLEVKGTFSTEAAFENLAYGTYYVAETDEYGNAITSDMVIVSNEISESKITLSPDKSMAFTTIINYVDLPDGYARDGKVMVNKKVLVNGSSEKVTDMFYFALFVDEECTMLSEAGVKTLKMEDESEGSVVFSELPFGQYYLAETDKDGVPVGNSFAYKVTVDQNTFTLNEANPSVTIHVTNEKEMEKETETETETENASETEAKKAEAAKTGDHNPITVYVWIMAAAVLAVALLLVFRRKRER